MTPATVSMEPLPPTASTSKKERSKLISKWNLLFPGPVSEWIAFKPQLGFYVFPCYVCRDMFSSKLSFLDHVNRRVMLIDYDCGDCKKKKVFYNRCSFLLHARSHFSLLEGLINLDKVTTSTLPLGMGGFLPHPDVVRLYDIDVEYVRGDCYVNAQFYNPAVSEMGKTIISLKPIDLLFYSTMTEGQTAQLALKQICYNVPLCQFITLDYQRRLKKNFVFYEMSNQVSNEGVKEEPVEDQFPMVMPVITNIESLHPSESSSTYPACPECKEKQIFPMSSHMTGNNTPFDDNLRCPKCHYIAPTKCSFSAHIRLHSHSLPFICPECGKESDTDDDLRVHMDEICFHLAKQIKFKCPGKRCNKLFALPATLAAHFVCHIDEWWQCSICHYNVENVEKFHEHAKTHKDPCDMKKIYDCRTCTEASIILKQNLLQHTSYHANDRHRRTYVLNCKHCKNSFRTGATYATHRSRCTKGQKIQSVKKQGFSFTLECCVYCHNRLVFYEHETTVICTKCKQLNILGITNQAENPNEQLEDDEEEVNACVLCDKELEDHEIMGHQAECKYRNPQVLIEKTKHFSKRSNHNIVDISTPSPKDKSDLQKSLDNGKKKRKRLAPSNSRSKKSTVSPLKHEEDLQAEQATPFNGTYYCKLCDFTADDRTIFHEHIIDHRDVSTSYQCMECGDCFVVKPSLFKHLMHYHKITDVGDYLATNDCYNKGAVQELEDVMKLAPGETRGPVKENQCRVCLEQFSESTELNKHFRIHGMAFLMKNSK